MYLCCDSPLFGLVYYRLWPLYYNYPVVAIVGLQPCLHSYIAIHCLPLNFCLTWAATPSSEPFNPWTTDPPLHPQLLSSCWASQDPARSLSRAWWLLSAWCEQGQRFLWKQGFSGSRVKGSDESAEIKLDRRWEGILDWSRDRQIQDWE